MNIGFPKASKRKTKIMAFQHYTRLEMILTTLLIMIEIISNTVVTAFHSPVRSKPVGFGMAQRIPTQLYAIIDAEVFPEEIMPNEGNSRKNAGRVLDIDVENRRLRKDQKKTTPETPKGDGTNLIELARKAQPELIGSRIPFIDPLGVNEFIDCSMHYIVELGAPNTNTNTNTHGTKTKEGTEETIKYCIATPFDHAVALVRQISGGRSEFIDKNDYYNTEGEEDDEDAPPPVDEELWSELFELAAIQMSERFGDNLALRETPGSLTILGDLDKYAVSEEPPATKIDRETGAKTILPETNDVTQVTKEQWDFIMNDDDDEEFFHEFMTQHLGKDYQKDVNNFDGMVDDFYKDEDEDDFDSTEKRKTMQGVDPDIARLFDTTMEEFRELMGEDVQLGSRVDTGVNNADEEYNHIAQRLFIFEHQGYVYSLVRMMVPTLILGKECPDGMNRMILLTPEEKERIMPMLEVEVKSAYEKALALSVRNAMYS